jgi:hypothetical protein
MTTELQHLRLNRIDLVDKGANPGAAVVLVKRDDSQEEPVSEKDKTPTVEDLQAQLAVEVQKREDAEAKLAEAKNDEGVTKRIADLEKEAKDAKAEADRNRDKLEKIEEETERREFIAKATEFEAAFGSPEVFGPILRKAHKTLNEDERKTLDGLLESVTKMVRDSALFREIGGGRDGETGGAWDKIQKNAAEKYPDKPKADAVSLYLKTAEGRKLHKAYRKEQEGE